MNNPLPLSPEKWGFVNVLCFAGIQCVNGCISGLLPLSITMDNAVFCIVFYFVFNIVIHKKHLFY